MEKADNNNAKMNSVDLNNAEAIREKANSLNAQKIKSINNFMQQNCGVEKNEKFCNDELKKHVSILCKYRLRSQCIVRVESSFASLLSRVNLKLHSNTITVSDNTQKASINVDLSKIERHAKQNQTCV